MRINVVVSVLALLVLPLLLGVRAPSQPGSAPTPQPPSSLQQALDRALDDERHAIAFYDAVMRTHGERRPFSNIIRAERRHEAALLGQYERLGLSPPPDRWASHTFEIPKSFAEVCDAAAVAEVRNLRLYEALEEKIEDEQVLAVFVNLRRASAERHLPAFQRHGSGWGTLDASALSASQQKQRDDAVLARGELFSTLLAELSEAIHAGGAANAIDVCAVRAPAIARDVSERHGVRIGRTSWKLRNPSNRPPVWADLATDDRPEEPTFFADRSGRLGALLPIRLAGNCLACHGAPSDLAPGVAGALARRYPADQATGFKAGDLRGWFWVEVPAGAGAPTQKQIRD
jgi:rubrerythrin